MINEKSARNKTIAISVEDGRQYLEKCITVNESVELSDILGKTIFLPNDKDSFINSLVSTSLFIL